MRGDGEMIRKNIGFKEEHESSFGYKYLQQQMARHPGLKESDTIEKIFEEHAQMTNELLGRQQLVEDIYLRLKKDLDVIRVRTGYADKNARINLELWNGFLLANNQEGYVTTDEFKTTPLDNAEKKVTADIDAYRIKKLEREMKKHSDEPGASE